ncbi:MAG: hypothetical protein JWM49_1856 [Microbacteriaceae bacterium]|nr:hypothetical protein [Microbacteriaceae bacterium]
MLNGYYIGIDTARHLNLGRKSNGWTGLQSATILGGAPLDSWFHLTVQASGCNVHRLRDASRKHGPANQLLVHGVRMHVYERRDWRPRSGQHGELAQYHGVRWRDDLLVDRDLPRAAREWNRDRVDDIRWHLVGKHRQRVLLAHRWWAGDKAVSGSGSWADDTANGDVQLGTSTGGNSNAGLIVRVSDPAVGVDSMDGYYAGVTPTQLVLGREAYGWTALASANLPVSLS